MFSQPAENDFIEYRIFLDEVGALGDRARQFQALLEAKQTFLHFLNANYIKDYIWQRHWFHLEVWNPEEQATIGPKKRRKAALRDTNEPHLFGCTEVGENIEDEWFITFLLFQLSKQYPHVTITVQDADGQFLLIESALSLPRWAARPEATHNRVFIRSGTLCLLPPPRNPSELTFFPSGTPSLDVAIRAIRHVAATSPDMGPIAAPKGVQQAIAQRLAGYPEAAWCASTHWVRCYVPLEVAHILRHAPQFVAAAVEAFYYRDPDDLRRCQIMKTYPPPSLAHSPSASASPSAPWVLTMVRFTRCLYAQLASQQFHPPRVFGSQFLPSKSHPDYKARALGLKLACGFEILCWHLEKAAASKPRVDTIAMATHLDMLAATELPCDIRAEEFSESQLRPDDSDKWMEVSPEEVDMLLQQNGAAKQPQGHSGVHQVDEEKQLNQLIEGVKAFVGHVSSFEGAEFPTDKPRTGTQTTGGGVSLDDKRLLETLGRVLGIPTEGPEESGSEDMSDEDYELMVESEEDESDEELTSVGASQPSMRQLMRDMDIELQESSDSRAEMISDVVEQATQQSTNPKPLQLDLQVVKNLLESYALQQGMAGPASTLLGALAESAQSSPPTTK